jgi:uncharacterized membrane protein YhaH (DUF805 family)
MKEFKDALSKYANFSGRASRRDFWMFQLYQSVILIALYIVTGILSSGGNTIFLALPSLVSIALLIPSLAVLVRRLHDTDHSGWHILFCLIPFFGGLWLLYLMVIAGTPGPNRFGESALPSIPNAV